MDSTPPIKKLGQLKQKARAPIGLAGRVYMNTEVISESPGGTFKLHPSQIWCSPLTIKNQITFGNK